MTLQEGNSFDIRFDLRSLIAWTPLHGIQEASKRMLRFFFYGKGTVVKPPSVQDQILSG
jgi:hypothetical protein